MARQSFFEDRRMDAPTTHASKPSIGLRDAMIEIGGCLGALAGSIGALENVMAQLASRADRAIDDPVFQEAQSIDGLTQSIIFCAKLVGELALRIPAEIEVDGSDLPTNLSGARTLSTGGTLRRELRDLSQPSGECEFF
jgi:hypothetical protein